MSISETSQSSIAASRLGLTNWRQNIIYIGFVVIFLVFAITLYDKGFLNPNNLLNIVRQTAMIAVMAIAMTFVLCGRRDRPLGRRGRRPRLGHDRDGDRRRRPAPRRARRPRHRPRGRLFNGAAHDADRHPLVPRPRSP